MRKLGVLMVLVFLAPCVMAQQTDNTSGTLGGEIPFLYFWSTTWDQSIGEALNSVTADDYDNTYFDIIGIIASSEIYTNDDCKISVKMGTWTVPTDYPVSGDKSDLTPDSDLLFKITGVDGAEDMSIVTPFDDFSNDPYLTTSDQDCLTADVATGVGQMFFGADARVELEWGVDVAGSYSVEITLTISQL